MLESIVVQYNMSQIFGNFELLHFSLFFEVLQLLRSQQEENKRSYPKSRLPHRSTQSPHTILKTKILGSQIEFYYTSNDRLARFVRHSEINSIYLFLYRLDLHPSAFIAIFLLCKFQFHCEVRLKYCGGLYGFIYDTSKVGLFL